MSESKNTFQLVIKTPLETVLDEKVKSLVVDTEEGKMMVLPHHTSLVGSISYSSIIISYGDQIKEFSLRNGFINIDNQANRTEITCIHCEKSQTVTFTNVEKYLNFLEGELKSDKLNSYQLEFLENEKFAVVKQLENINKEDK